VSSHSAGSPRPSGQLRWRLLAAGLTVVAVVCLLMWGAQQSSDSDASEPVSTAPASASTTGSASSGAVPQVAEEPPAVAPAQPVSLTIPSIAVRTRLTRLGLEDDGTVEVPTNAALAGWFDQGPPPGADGSSVILGHVDSTSGPAVFYRLRELQPGDRLAVRLDDGTTVEFRVHSTATYANEDFPAQKVYGRTGRPELNLVTCGGAYDSANGGYQSNVVVNARRV
jgi:LPXTG-site transpeptidase (sortase) family protein